MSQTLGLWVPETRAGVGSNTLWVTSNIWTHLPGLQQNLTLAEHQLCTRLQVSLEPHNPDVGPGAGQPPHRYSPVSSVTGRRCGHVSRVAMCPVQVLQSPASTSARRGHMPQLWVRKGRGSTVPASASAHSLDGRSSSSHLGP